MAKRRKKQTRADGFDEERFLEWCRLSSLPDDEPPEPEEMTVRFEGGGPFDGELMRVLVVRTDPAHFIVQERRFDRSQSMQRLAAVTKAVGA